MLAQMLLLPLYLWLFVGAEFVSAVEFAPFLEAFVLIIVLPLAAAALTQAPAHRTRAGRVVEQVGSSAMVPLMVITLAVVVAAQVADVGAQLGSLLRVVPVFLLFAAVMVPIGPWPPDGWAVSTQPAGARSCSAVRRGTPSSCCRSSSPSPRSSISQPLWSSPKPSSSCSSWWPSSSSSHGSSRSRRSRDDQTDEKTAISLRIRGDRLWNAESRGLGPLRFSPCVESSDTSRRPLRTALTTSLSTSCCRAWEGIEYRGYDSAGVAVVTEGGELAARKRAGKLANILDAVTDDPLPDARTGIGHTRWATHGGAVGRQRPPAPGRRWQARADPQRHHREFRSAQAGPRGRRRRVPLGDRHRGRRRPAGQELPCDR